MTQKDPIKPMYDEEIVLFQNLPLWAIARHAWISFSAPFQKTSDTTVLVCQNIDGRWVGDKYLSFSSNHTMPVRILDILTGEIDFEPFHR